MTLQELITIMQNRLITLTEAKKAAVQAGDVQRVSQIDNDLTTTLITIEQLQKSLNSKN